MANETKLLEVELENYTPIMFGGASGGWINIDGSIDYPRPTDLAGKVRWWLRSILSAAIYEEYGVFLPISVLDRIVGLVMGYLHEVAQQASKIVFKLIPVEDHEYSYTSTLESIKASYRRQLCSLYYEHGGKWAKAHRTCLEKLVENKGECIEENEVCCALASPRVLLSIMRKTPSEALGLIPLPPKKVKLRLIVTRRPGSRLDDREQRLLGAAIALATTVTGLGKAVTRGYGKLVPEDYESCSTPLRESYEEVVNMILSGNILDVIKSSVRHAREYLKCLRNSSREQLNRILAASTKSRNLPYAYTLHEKYVSIWRGSCTKLIYIPSVERVLSITCSSEKPWCIATSINTAVLKSTLKYIVTRDLSKVKWPGTVLKTEYLGLPRNKYTSRMLSPLIFAITKNDIYATLFLTAEVDILSNKNSKSNKRSKSKNIKDEAINLAMKILLKNYFSRSNLSMNCYENNPTATLFSLAYIVNDVLGLKLIHRGDSFEC